MNSLPTGLLPLIKYKQFILWTIGERNGKPVKLPINPKTLSMCKVTDPSAWTTFEEASVVAEYLEDFHVGFVFTRDDPFFFLDIDKCKNPDDTWSELATHLVNGLPRGAVESSQSGIGLHVFGVANHIPHACKNVPLGIELYTEDRFVALTGNMLTGDGTAETVFDLAPLVNTYFPPKVYEGSLDWTDAPVAEYTLDATDEELIKKAMSSGSARSMFGAACSFRELWEADEDALSKHFPGNDGESYDASSADMALANHLSYWTGRNCVRMLCLMMESGLVRDKWEREAYIKGTILDAARTVTKVYDMVKADATLAKEYGGDDLVGKSEGQISFAEQTRANVLMSANEEQRAALSVPEGPLASATFWLNNKEKGPAELAELAGKAERAGFQLLSADQQIKEYFAGFVYVVSLNKVFTHEYGLLTKDQFNNRYSSGYEFMTDHVGEKKTKKAWDAFTGNSAFITPVAGGTCFRPDEPTGDIINEAGASYVNTYVPVDTKRTVGDASPFINHLNKLLPDTRDRQILLSYLAAVVQYKGTKFYWAPLIQGVEGNGKSLFTSCLTFAVGERYTHMPPANEITEKFNDWLFQKIFIGVEDVYVSQEKREVMEVLKPMITNHRLACRAMQQGQVMGDNRANFLLNSNHKDAILKTINDRRYAIFYTAQQEAEHLIRDKMTPDYFAGLYSWLNRGDGFAIVNEFLHTYAIPDEFNPAGSCNRAPRTTSTDEAITASLGPVEQLLIEAVESGVPGFQGGWISSGAFFSLLDDKGRSRSIAPNKVRDLMKSLGYVLHPSLNGKRTNNRVSGNIDADKKIMLYVKEGSEEERITGQPETIRSYKEAQSEVEKPDASHEMAKAVFGKK